MHAFEFTPLRREDFPLLSGWLGTPHVARWWDDEPSLDAVERDYGGCVDGTEPSEVFIAHGDGVAVGLIQRYRFGAYPHYAGALAHLVHVPADTSSIDYLIGPPQVLGKGIGSAMIAAFVARTWKDDPATPAILVPVHVDNRASWRALDRAGFARRRGTGTRQSKRQLLALPLPACTIPPGVTRAPCRPCQAGRRFVAKCISCKRTHQFRMCGGKSL